MMETHLFKPLTKRLLHGEHHLSVLASGIGLHMRDPSQVTKMVVVNPHNAKNPKRRFELVRTDRMIWMLDIGRGT